MALEINKKAFAELKVADEHLATYLIQKHPDDFPAVFATAKMIGLMELAASRVLHSELKEGEVSVGVTVDISHTAATAVGDTVVCEARFSGMDGKLFSFEITARDSGGEVGRGTHKRAIVSKDRLLSGIAKRVNGR